jgi:hypothetical protein
MLVTDMRTTMVMMMTTTMMILSLVRNQEICLQVVRNQVWPSKTPQEMIQRML